MNKILKIAIVGCGQFAEAHVQEIKKIGLANIVAVCDTEELMAQQLAERYIIPEYFDDFKQLLHQVEPDVVHITTPPQSHLDLAKVALSSGCHAYIEKPFSIDYEKSDEIIKLAEKVGKKVTVGHSYLFEPCALEMRKLISQGLLGEPIHVESHYGYNLSGPFGAGMLGNKSHWVHKLPGKLFHNNIDHLINKIMEHIPDEKPRIHAIGYRIRPEAQGGSRDNMFDELRVMITGYRTSGYATFSSHANPVAHFSRIYGSKNTMYVDYVARTIVLEKGQKYPSAIGRLLPPFGMAAQYVKQGKRNISRFMKNDFHFFSGMNRLMKMFYESILYETPVPIPYGEIRRMAAITDEIFSQVKQG